MTVLEAMKAYLGGCPAFQNGAEDIQLDFPGTQPVSYALASKGAHALRAYVDGTVMWEHLFELYSLNSTQAESDRQSKNAFFESLADWVQQQNRLGVFPSMTGVQFESIETLDAQLKEKTENSDNATYVIQIKTIYLKRSAE